MIPNAIPKEKLYVTLGILGGFGTWFLSTDIWSGNVNQKSNTIGKSLLIGSASYSISRALFKQNPKNSLIIGALLFLGNIAYDYNNSNQKQEPKLPIRTPQGGGI
jgi:hypothetical protein